MPIEIIGPVIAKRTKELQNEMERRNLKTIEEKEIDQWIDDFAKVELNEAQQKLYVRFYNVYYLSRYYKGLPQTKFPSFEKLRLAQDIVVKYALTEGFLSDSLYNVCKVKPEIIKCDKEITFKDALSYSGIELVEHITARFVFSICEGNLDNKIENVCKKLRLNLELTDIERKNISELVLIRNSIVHNSGKVTQEYRKSYGSSKMELSDEIPLEEKHIEDLSDTLIDITYRIFYLVTKKFFGQIDSNVVPPPMGVN